MIQVQFANYLSRRLEPACKLCNQPAPGSQYQICKQCMKLQAEKLAQMWAQNYPVQP